MFFRLPTEKLRALLNAINSTFSASEISLTQQNVLYATPILVEPFDRFRAGRAAET